MDTFKEIRMGMNHCKWTAIFVLCNNYRTMAHIKIPIMKLIFSLKVCYYHEYTDASYNCFFKVHGDPDKNSYLYHGYNIRFFSRPWT